MTNWTNIVQQHGPAVWQTACRLLSNEADAADCFQRTFLAALELSQRETVVHWPALLRRLATRRALECLRQRYREGGRRATLPESWADRKTLGPSEAAEAGELAEHLRAALAELEEGQAQVFCLACLDDCSYQEIADQLGITVNHVGVLLHRARANLQERLQAHRLAPSPGHRGGSDDQPE
jgi:RNA polymerase sigma-70 factor (ECF subfamily)